jgi:hypothetical protein
VRVFWVSRDRLSGGQTQRGERLNRMFRLGVQKITAVSPWMATPTFLMKLHREKHQTVCPVDKRSAANG